MKRLRGNCDPMKEIAEMEKEKQEAASEKRVSIGQLFSSSKYRQAVIVALMVQISQQFSGINAVRLPKMLQKSTLSSCPSLPQGRNCLIL